MAAPTPRDLQERYGFRVDALARLGGSDRAWRVDSERGPLVLRLHGTDRFSAHAGEVVALRFLAEHDYPAPRLIPALDDSSLFRCGQMEGYLTTFVAGSSLPATVDTAWQLGEVTGRLHALETGAAGLPPTPFTIASERQHFHSLNASPAVHAWDGYAELRDDLVRAWDELPDLDDMPQVLVHTDVLFGNAVQTPEGQAVLIDWDDAGLGPAIQDLGYLLVHESIPLQGAPIESAFVLAVLDGYQTARPLTSVERSRIPEAMLFGALAYVLAPWESRVWLGNWRRARCVLEHRAEIVALLNDAV